MSTISKHNNLSTFLTYAYGTINLSGVYSILNENSNINVKNSTINHLIPSFIINNGTTNIIDSNVEDAFENNIIIDNSNNYIDNLQYNNKKYSFVQNGSLFPYSNIVLAPSTSFFDPTSNDYQLIIPIHDKWKNRKDEYIQEHGIENIGTGNQFYSTHFLNDGSYGYWGNKYGGQWIKDVTSGLNINSIQDLNTCLNTIPRNLNGYTVKLIYTDTNITNLNINNFYNGTLNLVFQNDLYNSNTVQFNINNNNLTLNIEFSGAVNIVKFNINDNKDANMVFNEINTTSFQGDNNYLTLNFKDVISRSATLFNNNSYGNKVVISSITDNEAILTRQLAENNKIYGNYITVLSIEDKLGDLVNDNAEIIEYDEDQVSQYMNFTIDEVHPKMFRDVSDIGTIIGWNADLPIPRGYYKCDGSEIAVDLNNPQDEFYNGQLAYYLNGNLSTKTIKLPNIPSTTPVAVATDINSDICTCKPRYLSSGYPGGVGIVYIIKYNNNFENKKGNETIIPPSFTPLPKPTPTPTPDPISTSDPQPVNVYASFIYNYNDDNSKYTESIEAGTSLRLKALKSYGGTFDRTCTLKIPRQNGDTTSGSKYVLSQLSMKSKAHGHWVDPAAYTIVQIKLNNTTIDMHNKILYGCTVSTQRLGVPDIGDEEEIITSYTKTNAISINKQNFVDIKVERTDNNCTRWSHTTAYTYADNSYIYIVLHVVCYSHTGALENNIWYTDVNQITGTGCKFYGKN